MHRQGARKVVIVRTRLMQVVEFKVQDLKLQIKFDLIGYFNLYCYDQLHYYILSANTDSTHETKE